MEGQPTQGVSMQPQETDIGAWALVNDYRILKKAA